MCTKMITGGCNVLQPNEFPDTAEEGTGMPQDQELMLWWKEGETLLGSAVTASSVF